MRTKEIKEVIEGSTPVTRRRVFRQGLEVVAAAAGASVSKKAFAQGAERQQQPLILRNDDLAAKTEAFFKELNTNPRLQSEFINNPSGVITRRFLLPSAAAQISPQRLNNANRILYSVIANDRFRIWAQEYQTNIDKLGKIDKSQVVKDFSAAVIRFGDAALVQGLIEESFLASAGKSQNPTITFDCTSFFYVYTCMFMVSHLAFVVSFASLKGENIFTAQEFRAVANKMIANSKQMEKAGSLKESLIR